MTSVSRYQRISVDGKTYDVTWYDNGHAKVSLLTKKGSRTLNGRGRAYRPELIDRVLAAAGADTGGNHELAL